MLKALLCIAVLSCVPLTLPAQETPRVEVFTGYSYLRASDSLSQRVNQNGWDLSVAANFSRSFSLVADISNHYGTINYYHTTSGVFTPIGTGGKGFSFLFGPQVSYRGVPRLTPFARMLFGGMRASKLVSNSTSGGGTDGGFGTVPGPLCNDYLCVEPATSFAMAFGGGLDVKATDHIWIRPFQMDYVRAEITTGYGTIATQNDLRISAGIVFRFGRR
ncbi:MAG: hypothetical protein LAO07_03925 [Acidobacteriia bacterium]|nr:hypothetical protein [Terriglobia bacterium]